MLQICPLLPPQHAAQVVKRAAHVHVREVDVPVFVRFQRLLEQLPIPGSGCGDIRIASDGVDTSIEYEYWADGADWIGEVRFSDCIAHRFRNEMHSKGYCSESYEALAEVKDSPWLAELIRDEPTGIRDATGKKHFAVFLSSNGYIEVIADAFVMCPPRKGLLNS